MSDDSDKVHKDIQKLVEAAAIKMRTEYDRIGKWSSRDAGTAGDEGEENWKQLLERWLPAHYHVVTKGRILHRNGASTGQFDVLVLQPEYPRGLLNTKLYLAEGVAAAFECKLALRGEHIKKFQRIAAETQRSCGQRPSIPKGKTTPRKELASPIAMGILAHSHDWKESASKPEENVKRNLHEGDKEYAQHPREVIDCICISDLGTWVAGRNALLTGKSFGPEGMVGTSFTEFSPKVERESSRTLSADSLLQALPIGVFLTKLLERLAWENPRLRGVSRHLTGTPFATCGQGEVRLWPLSVFSDEVKAKLLSQNKTTWGAWDEWAPRC